MSVSTGVSQGQYRQECNNVSVNRSVTRYVRIGVSQGQYRQECDKVSVNRSVTSSVPTVV